MRLSIAAGFVAMASMATPPREARRVTVLVEHDADEATTTRIRCTATPPADASSADRDAAVADAARRALRVDDDAFVDVHWRRADVATAAVSRRRDPKALPGRAFATLAALDVNGVSLALPARDAVVDGNHAAATAATPWDGGVVLAAYAATRPELFRGKSVVA